MTEDVANKAGVDWIDLDARLMYMEDGGVLPVTNLVSRDSDQVGDPRLATAAVGGPTAEGRWVQAAVDDYDRVRSGFAPIPTPTRVDRAAGTATFADGRVLPVDEWLGIDEDTEVPAATAYFAVVNTGAGKVPGGEVVQIVRLEETDDFEVV